MLEISVFNTTYYSNNQYYSRELLFNLNKIKLDDLSTRFFLGGGYIYVKNEKKQFYLNCKIIYDYKISKNKIIWLIANNSEIIFFSENKKEIFNKIKELINNGV